MANRPGFNLFYIVGDPSSDQGRLAHLRLGPTGAGKQTYLDNEDFQFGRGIGAYAASDSIHVFARQGGGVNDDTNLFEIVYSNGSGGSPTPVTGVTTNDQVAAVTLGETVHLFYGSRSSTSGSLEGHTIHTVSRPVGSDWGPVRDLGVPVSNGVSAVVVEGKSILLAYQAPDNSIETYDILTEKATTIPVISCWYTPFIVATGTDFVIIYQGSNNLNQLYSILSVPVGDGLSWQYNQNVQGQAIWDSPTAIGSDNGLFCFYRGNGPTAGNTNQLYLASYTSSYWLPTTLALADNQGTPVGSLLFGPCAVYIGSS